MKKFTKILSLLLAAMMLLSLVACDKSGGGNSKKEETVVGKWEGTLSQQAMDMVLGELDMDLDTEVAMHFEFGEDGKGKLSFDEDDMKKLASEAAAMTLDVMAQSSGMSADDLLSAMGMTKDEFIDAAIAEADFSELENTYTYTVDGDKLTLTDSDGVKTVITFAFENGNLVMKDAEEEDAEELMAVMFPMTLKRVK